MKHEGSCSCGNVKIDLDTDPFLNYNCHCSHCRTFGRSVIHHGAAMWRWNVKVNGAVKYEKTTSLFGLFGMSRGRCESCEDPIVEWCERLMYPFAMVMGKPLKLPPASVNIFYNSGLQQGTNDLLTIRSDLGSMLYEFVMIVLVAIPNLPRSICARFTNRQQ